MVLSTKSLTLAAGRHTAAFTREFFALTGAGSGTSYSFVTFESASAQFAATALAIEGGSLAGFPISVPGSAASAAAGIGELADGSITAAKLANAAVTTDKIADSAITAGKVATGQVVKSINSLKDAVVLTAGTNVTITPSGNGLIISATSTGTGTPGVAGPQGLTGATGPAGPGLPLNSLHWIDVGSLQSIDSNVKIVANSANAFPFNGMTATATAPGDTISISMYAPVPPGYSITGVRLCYNISNARSFISQVRLTRVNDPPTSQNAWLDDGTDLVALGPICVDTGATTIDPELGAIKLFLRLKFADATDRITIISAGLHLLRK